MKVKKGITAQAPANQNVMNKFYCNNGQEVNLNNYKLEKADA